MKKSQHPDPQPNIPQLTTHLQYTLPNKKLGSFKFVDENTFINVHRLGKTHIFQYMSHDGSILSKLSCPVADIKEYIVISESEVVILENDEINNNSVLVLWNFRINHFERIVVKLPLQDKNHYHIGILYFHQSNLLFYWSKHIKYQFLYFKISQIKSGVPFHEYVCEDLSNQPFWRKIVKLNEKSKIGLFLQNYKFNEKVYQYCYDIDLQKSKGSLSKFQINVSQILNYEEFDFLICHGTDFWEVSPQILYFQVYLSVSTIGQFQQSQLKVFFDPKKHERYHTFYYDLQQNKGKIGKINPPQAHRLQFINSVRPVPCTEIQRPTLSTRSSSKYNFMAYKLAIKGIPVYYIEPNGQKVINKNPPITKNQYCDEELVWLNYRTDKMFKITKKQQHREVTVYRFPQEEWYSYSCGLKVLAVFWILQIVQDCCEDLLEMIYDIL